MPRVEISGTIPDDLHFWLMQQIEKREFHNISHALELGLLALKGRGNYG